MSRIKIISVTRVVKIFIMAMIIHEMQDFIMRKSLHTPENHNKKKNQIAHTFQDKIERVYG